MMYNTLKCFGDGRKKGCAINKILICDQRNINDGSAWVTAHVYLQVIPPLGGSCTRKKQGCCKDEGIWQQSTSKEVILGEIPSCKDLSSILRTRARQTTEDKPTPTALLQDKTQCCDRCIFKLTLKTGRDDDTIPDADLTMPIFLLLLVAIFVHFWLLCAY